MSSAPRGRWAGAVIAVLALGGLVGWMGGGSSAYVVRAEFDDLAGVRENSDVKIGGVPVGRVDAVDVTEGDTGLAILELDRDVARLGRDATARARPASVVGDMYLELEPGDVDRPLPDGATIPRSRTSTAVALDDVLDMLSPDVRTRLRILINETGAALTGRGEDFGELLYALPPALEANRELLAELTRDNARLRNLVVRGDRVLSTMARTRGDLVDLVSTASGALERVADRRAKLGRAVAAAPASLRRLRQTLGELTSMTGELRLASAEVRRSAPPLAQLLGELPAFERSAIPALWSLRESAPALVSLARRGAPQVERLQPTAETLRQFARSSRPATSAFHENRFDFLGFVEGWARSIQGRDNLGHFARAQFIVNQELAESLVNAYVRPSAPERRQPAADRERRSRDRDRAGAVPRGTPQSEAPRPDGGRRPGLPQVDVPTLDLPSRGVPQAGADYLLDFLLGP